MRFFAAGVVVGLVLGGTVAVAQSWDSLYVQAIEDLQAARWQPAVTKLQEAIRQNPRSGHSMRTDVTKTVGYFPYFLLGKAYYHLGRHEEALQSFTREDPRRLPAKMTEEIAGYQRAIRAVQADRRVKEFQQSVDKAEAARQKGLFGEAAGHLQRAREISQEQFEKRRFGGMLVDMQGLAKKQQTEKETLSRFQTILGQASQKEKEGALQTARLLLGEAEQILPGRPEVNDLKTRIDQREARYTQLKEGASLDEKEGRFGSAVDKLKEAAEIDPERFNTDKLAQLVDSLSSRQVIQNHFRAAAKALEDRSYRQAIAQYDLILQKDPRNATAVAEKARARSLELLSRGQELASEGSFDQALSAFGLAGITYRSNGYLIYDQMDLYTERLRGNRLEQPWLDVMRDADPATFASRHRTAPQQTVRRTARSIARRSAARGPARQAGRAASDDAVRDATYSALSAPPQEAIRQLEQVRASQKSTNAELESAAGIAYARLSLLTANREQREKLREKAKEHFRTALAVKPAQTVNPRLVSPQIVKLFTEVQEEELRQRGSE